MPWWISDTVLQAADEGSRGKSIDTENLRIVESKGVGCLHFSERIHAFATRGP